MIRWLTAVLLAFVLGGCGGGGSPAPAPAAAPTDESQPHSHGDGQVQVSLLVGDGTEKAAAGYSLDRVELPGAAAVPGVVRFRVTYEGDPLQAYVPEQTKDLHLYVVRTDLAVFRHLHPTRDATGTWSAPLTLPEPGDYRVVTQFVARDQFGDGDSLMLGRTATVPGPWSPRPVNRPAIGDDGTLKVRPEGAGAVGASGEIRLRVQDAQGRPVKLGTYLGVFAHVTAFHVGSGSIVHMHPIGSPEIHDDGTVVALHTEFEKPGDYLAFVQVRVDGLIHTLPVALDVA